MCQPLYIWFRNVAVYNEETGYYEAILTKDSDNYITETVEGDFCLVPVRVSASSMLFPEELSGLGDRHDFVMKIGMELNGEDTYGIKYLPSNFASKKYTAKVYFSPGYEYTLYDSVFENAYKDVLYKDAIATNCGDNIDPTKPVYFGFSTEDLQDGRFSMLLFFHSENQLHKAQFQNLL